MCSCLYRDSHSSQGMSTSFPSSATTSSSGPYYCSELLFLCVYSALQPQASHTDLQKTTRWVKSVVNRNNSASLPRRVGRNLKTCRPVFPAFGFLFLFPVNAAFWSLTVRKSTAFTLFSQTPLTFSYVVCDIQLFATSYQFKHLGYKYHATINTMQYCFITLSLTQMMRWSTPSTNL